jgi:hypothetical protein
VAEGRVSISGSFGLFHSEQSDIILSFHSFFHNKKKVQKTIKKLEVETRFFWITLSSSLFVIPFRIFSTHLLDIFSY